MNFDELNMHKTVIFARRFMLFGMAALGTTIGLRATLLIFACGAGWEARLIVRSPTHRARV